MTQTIDHEARWAILDRANARGVWVRYPSGDASTATITGYRLDHPVVNHPFGQTEISWALAERLANGEARWVLL